MVTFLFFCYNMSDLLQPVRERDTYESRYDSEATDPLLYTAFPDQMDTQTALWIKTVVLLLPPIAANAVHKVITCLESNGRLETSYI